MTHACRLYLITPPQIDDIPQFVSDMQQAVSGGDIACLQVRLKDKDGRPAPDNHIKSVVNSIISITQQNDIALLINDRPDLAAELNTDGVHIGQEDGSYAKARELVGEDAIVGVTCHDSKHLALLAGEQGADYVAFGAFYDTETKNPKAKAELDLLTWWQQFIELPCVAIGGITPDNAAPLVSAGADFLAVSSGVWNHPEGPKAAVEAFNRVFADNQFTP